MKTKVIVQLGIASAEIVAAQGAAVLTDPADAFEHTDKAHVSTKPNTDVTHVFKIDLTTGRESLI